MTSKAAKAKGAERKQRMDTSSLMEQIVSNDNLNAYVRLIEPPLAEPHERRCERSGD